MTYFEYNARSRRTDIDTIEWPQIVVSEGDAAEAEILRWMERRDDHHD